MRWIWNEEKNAVNQRKHGLDFETAMLVFDDPLATSRRDYYLYEERWQTIGIIDDKLILVVHTMPEIDTWTGEETGRIISARKATAYERRTYEEDDF